MTDPGDRPHTGEAVLLLSLEYDGVDEAAAGILSGQAGIFLAELETAVAQGSAYRDAHPPTVDMDAAQLLARGVKAQEPVVRVERQWDKRLGVVRTNNMTVNMPRMFAGRNAAETEAWDGFMQNCTLVSRRFRDAYMTGDGSPESAQNTQVLRWLRDLYMTEALRRYIDMGAADSDILEWAGQEELSDRQREFIDAHRRSA